MRQSTHLREKKASWSQRAACPVGGEVPVPGSVQEGTSQLLIEHGGLHCTPGRGFCLHDWNPAAVPVAMTASVPVSSEPST